MAPGPSGSVHRFTPHHFLAALAADPRRLALTPGARTVLGIALWRAGRTGEGEGCRPGEAMFVRRLATHDRARTGDNTLCGDARMSKWAVRQAIGELARSALVRVVFVRPLQRLPRLPNGGGGQRVAETVAVFYLDVRRLKVLFGVGTEKANGAVSQPPGGLCGSNPTPGKSAGFGAPPVKISTDQASGDTVVNRDHSNHNHRGGTPPNPPPGGGGSKEIPSEIACTVERVFAAWWARIGRRRQRSDAPPPRLVAGVQSAIATALGEGYTVAHLEAAIAARADRTVGGAAYDFCEAPPRHPDRPIWAAGMFAGPLDQLIAHANAHAQRQRAAASSAYEREADRGTGAVDPSTRPRAAQAAANDLRKLIGVDPDPAWLSGRQGATGVDGERAAFRPPRRR